MARGRYKTKQQESIEEFLKEHAGESYTADKLCSDIACEGITIGKATVYRCLERLLEDGYVIAVPDVDLGSIRYSYTDQDSADMYMMCNICHKVKPLHCEAIDRFMTHVANEHEFRPNSQKTIMYGECKECGDNE